MNLVEIQVTVFELTRYIGALWTDGRMDEQTDRQTDGRSRQQYPFGPKGRGVKKNNPNFSPEHLSHLVFNTY